MLQDHPLLKNHPVVVHVEVRWGDMDALGHVNNIVYLQYFETARIEYLMRLGLDPPGPAWSKIGMIIASVDCRFLAPVTFPDTLRVGARVTGLGTDRFVMEHLAISHKLGRPVARGNALVVAYDYAARKRTALPTHLREGILALEGREVPTYHPSPKQRG